MGDIAMRLLQQKQTIRQRAARERERGGKRFNEDFYYRCEYSDLLAEAIDVIARLEQNIAPQDVIEIAKDLGVSPRDAKRYLMKHGYIQDESIKPSREEMEAQVGPLRDIGNPFETRIPA